MFGPSPFGLLRPLRGALNVAAGAILGTYLGRPIADQLSQIRFRARRRHAE